MFSGSVLIAEPFEFTLGHDQSPALSLLHFARSEYTCHLPGRLNDCPSVAPWRLDSSGPSACQSGKWTRGDLIPACRP
jgi:hypothetical protein